MCVSAFTGESSAGRPGGLPGRVELAIGGMTCASCAAGIEKKLNKLDGVTATVNFATETARVSFPAAVSAGDVISVVQQAGYSAVLPAPSFRGGGHDRPAHRPCCPLAGPRWWARWSGTPPFPPGEDGHERRRLMKQLLGFPKFDINSMLMGTG
jgi:copper chaperone CopZ